MLGLISLLVLPFSTLIPYYAKDVFKGTASTFGIIDSFIGLGAFSGAIFLASQKAGADLRKILFINTAPVFGTGLILFSHEGNYPLALMFATLLPVLAWCRRLPWAIPLYKPRLRKTCAAGWSVSMPWHFLACSPWAAYWLASISGWIGTTRYPDGRRRSGPIIRLVTLALPASRKVKGTTRRYAGAAGVAPGLTGFIIIYCTKKYSGPGWAVLAGHCPFLW